MNWTLDDTWIVIIGMLCAGSCALLGNFLVLRRMSMMGDAISHAVLPGLVAAFWFTGSRSSFTMFAGAAVVGVLTAVFTQWVQSFGKVDRGASMGVVFTTLFAIGLIMLNVAIQEHKVDLDPDTAAARPLCLSSDTVSSLTSPFAYSGGVIVTVTDFTAGRGTTRTVCGCVQSSPALK